jgi:hypothetical protein
MQAQQAAPRTRLDGVNGKGPMAPQLAGSALTDRWTDLIVHALWYAGCAGNTHRNRFIIGTGGHGARCAGGVLHTTHYMLLYYLQVLAYSYNATIYHVHIISTPCGGYS